MPSDLCSENLCRGCVDINFVTRRMMCNMMYAFVMMLMTVSIPCKHNLKVHSKLVMTVLKVNFYLSCYWTIPHFPP